MNNRDSEEATASVLHIRKQPPFSVFLEEAFETDIVVEGTSSFQPDNNQCFNILASLVHEQNSLNLDSTASLVVLLDPSPLLSGVTGTIRCSIATRTETRAFFEGNPIFRIHISALDAATDSEGTPKVIATVVTSKVLLVRYKILVSPEVDWSNVWYKDEGGRDKCMEVMAGVYDHQLQLLYEAVPLLLTLCYYSLCSPPIPVTNQDILRILGPKSNNNLTIDKSTGTIKIRFRVEDVSKNHQGQDFCVQIAVSDSREGSRRIAPGLTPPITIRSKRNKRGRISTSTPTSSTTDVSSERKLQRAPVPPSDPSGSTRHGGAALDGPDAIQLREAVRGLAQWVDDVVTGLYPLQWQIVGYAQDANGNRNYSRPFHNMQNPNALISRVLTIYNDSTREQLRLLQQAVEAQDPQPLSSSLLYPMYPAAGAGALPPPSSRDHRYSMNLPRYTVPYVPLQEYHGGTLAMSVSQQPRPYSQPHSRKESMVASTPVDPGRAALPKMSQSNSSSRETPKASPVRMTEHEIRAGAASNEQYSVEGSETQIPSPYDTRESEVEYLLAKQFKSIRTGERLGFPAYSSNKELLGFYQKPSTKVGPGIFVSISEDDFGPGEKLQATMILEQAEESAVHSLTQWGSVNNMLNRALVYEWSQGLEAKSKK
jgi:hypothetical protein